MIEHLATVAIFLAAAFAVGFGVDLWSFSIGDPHQDEVDEGRIGSWLGRRLLAKFHKFEQREEKRIGDLHTAGIDDAVTQWKKTNPGDKFPGDHPVFSKTYPKRTNWWKVTGVCPHCCCTWVAWAFFGIMVVVFGLSAWWLLAAWPFAGVASFALSLAMGMRG